MTEATALHLNIRTVLFDLDGTLADTAPDLALALNTLLEEEGHHSLPYERIRQEASYGGIALIKLGFKLEPESPEFEPLRQRFLDLYKDKLCEHTTLFEGMDKVIDAIDAAGMNWGIVTNKPSWLTDPLIKNSIPKRWSLSAAIPPITANPTPNRCYTPAKPRVANPRSVFMSETPNATSKRGNAPA